MALTPNKLRFFEAERKNWLCLYPSNFFPWWMKRCQVETMRMLKLILKTISLHLSLHFLSSNIYRKMFWLGSETLSIMTCIIYSWTHFISYLHEQPHTYITLYKRQNSTLIMLAFSFVSSLLKSWALFNQRFF